MNAVQPNQCQPTNSDLEQPSVELVETLKAIMHAVYIPAGLRSFNPEESDAIKEFACQLPVSRGFNPATLHLLHRVVVSQFEAGQSTTTVDWPMLVRAWSEFCESRQRSDMISGLPRLLEWCFEPGRIRVIGLMELTWDADNRRVIIRVNQPNFARMNDYLTTAFNIEVGEQSPTSQA